MRAWPGGEVRQVLVQTRLFGELEVAEDDVFLFPSGLYGLRGLRRFAFLAAHPESPLRYMQSLDDGDISFVVLDPAGVLPDYRPEIPAEERASLSLDDSEGVLLVIAVVPDDVREATVNLRAPLLLNPATRTGKQVILPDDRYPIRQRLFA